MVTPDDNPMVMPNVEEEGKTSESFVVEFSIVPEHEVNGIVEKYVSVYSFPYFIYRGVLLSMCCGHNTGVSNVICS